MDVGMLVLRLFHVGLGVFWAGTMLFFVFLLEPSIREAGPEGGKVVQALMRRGYLNIMPVVALLTILSGVDLLRRASGGFNADWMGSAEGMTFLVGSVAAILALVTGVTVMRPSALRMTSLMQAMGQAQAGPEKERLGAEVAGLRQRMTTGGRVIAVLLIIAVATMAVARYLK
jgi:hypothetical protein